MDTDWSYKHKTLPGHELELRLNTRHVSCGSLTADPTHAPLVTAQGAVQLRAEGGSDNNTVSAWFQLSPDALILFLSCYFGTLCKVTG